LAIDQEKHGRSLAVPVGSQHVLVCTQTELQRYLL
jgi:hypothetical protein